MVKTAWKELLPKHLYRYVRPSIVSGYKRVLGSRVLERNDILDDHIEGFTVFPFGSHEYYEFEEPRHIGELPQTIKTKLHGYQVLSPFVVEVSEATLVGPSAIAFSNGHVLLESARGSYFRLVDASVRALLNGQIPWETRLQLPIKRYDEPVFSLVGPWDTEYYHWLTDYLVRVFSLEAYREQTGHDPYVLIPESPSDWMRDSLSLTGFDKSKTIEWDGSRAQFSQLVVGSVRFHTPANYEGYIHSPEAMAKLGSRIRDTVGVDSGKARRLYVSRADATKRRVSNEGELVSKLEGYGFEQIVPGRLSFSDQVKLFADAEYIVGPHGAGLTNIIFAKEATLIELFGSYRNACYFGLARGMGHKYVSVACHPDGDDMEVDTSTVGSLLDDLISDP